jgi:hypothetical protein
MTTGIEATLLDLENRRWEANRNAHANFYRGYITDDALVVSRFGVFDRDRLLDLLLRSSNAVHENPPLVAWGRWRAAPHPRAGAGVELQGRHPGGQGIPLLTIPAIAKAPVRLRKQCAHIPM